MATSDVPGANPVNKDKLTRGCWAEHEDGSLIYVKDIAENDVVVFEMYDFKRPGEPVYYPSAMPLVDFQKTFSFNPKKKDKTNLKWTWHDKTPMPWERVMREIEQPTPVAANVADTLSAAARIAESLHARMHVAVDADHVRAEQGLELRPASRRARGMGQRIKDALAVLVD